MNIKVLLPVKALPADNKCGRCPLSLCCRYVTQRIPVPRSVADFDHLLWQVSHVGVEAFKDKDGWFLLVNTPCTHLLPDGRCGDYAERPLICRRHSNHQCELDGAAELGFDLYFPDVASLLHYCRQRFKRWDAHRARLRAAL
jgi:Fe-S-cluster containining protein